MLRWNQLFRFVALWTLAFWMGGFTFYAGAVIPVLHDQLGGALESGLVTQRVTIDLNLLGVNGGDRAGAGDVRACFRVAWAMLEGQPGPAGLDGSLPAGSVRAAPGSIIG